MRNKYLDLPDRIEHGFSELDSDIVIDLRKTNEEYSELQKQISQLQQKNPFINRIMEDEGEVGLSVKEHNIFLQYLRLCRKIDNMEPKHIYFREHTDAMAYLKKIKAI